MILFGLLLQLLLLILLQLLFGQQAQAWNKESSSSLSSSSTSAAAHVATTTTTTDQQLLTITTSSQGGGGGKSVHDDNNNKEAATQEGECKNEQQQQVSSSFIIRQHQEQQQQQDDDSSSSNSSSSSDSSNNKILSCSIWLAPSSLHGHAGFGIYTTRALKQGETLLRGGMDGPAIAVLHPRQQRQRHYGTMNDNDDANDDYINDYKLFNKLWDDYWWSFGMSDHIFLGADASDDNDGPEDFQITLGSLANHHCLLQSVSTRAYPTSTSKTSTMMTAYNDEIITIPTTTAQDNDTSSSTSSSSRMMIIGNRYNSPGVGASSYNMGREWITTRNVQVNEEIFLNYYYCHVYDVHSQNYHKWPYYIPMLQDFKIASQLILQQWYDIVQQQQNIDVDNDNETAANDVQLNWNHLLHEQGQDEKEEDNDDDDVQIMNQFVQALLPKTLSELRYIMTTFQNNNNNNSTTTTTNGTDIQQTRQQQQQQQHDQHYKIMAAATTKEQQRKSSNNNNDNDDDSTTIATTTSIEFQQHVARKMATIERTTEWIHNHGLCLENIKPGPSHIPHAGQGAILQFPLNDNDNDNNLIIVPVPMLHITNKSVLNIYNNNDNEDDESNSSNNNDEPIGIELLLNYCLGHDETPILLCPLTNAILINHCSNRTKMFQSYCPNGPNAEYRWASLPDFDPNSAIWQNMTIPEIKMAQYNNGNDPRRGLSMQVVSIRPIQVGEEIFVDYGVQWENAWIQHVENWKPPPSQQQQQQPWLSAKEANDDVDGAYYHNGNSDSITSPILIRMMKPVRSEFLTGNLRSQLEPTDLHPYLMTACRYWTSDWEVNDDLFDACYDVDDDDADDKEDVKEWEQLSDQELLTMYADDGSRFVVERSAIAYSDKSHWPCTVVKAEQQQQDHDNNSTTPTTTYIVRIHQSDWHSSPYTTTWDYNDVPRFLTNYPRASIRYFVKPNASDQTLKGAFRHAIGIPDNILPDQWRIIPKKEKMK